MAEPNEQENFDAPVAYDPALFLQQFTETFRGSPKYNAGASHRALGLLRMIERDPGITDVRWAAYMLATTMWETTSPANVQVQATNKKGALILDKSGKATTVTKRKWVFTMAPVAEVGKGAGRRYHEPVKIKLLSDGCVRITEHDGDQFKIKPNGSFVLLTKGAKQGATDGAAVAAAYLKDDGIEQVYYGRGYVQLTWWSNYAKAGASIGLGYQLLLDPDMVKRPEVAYMLMSYGMVTGKIFANGHTFDDYLYDGVSNYEGARRMVNGRDHAADIAAIARKIEKVLLKSRAMQSEMQRGLP